MKDFLPLVIIVGIIIFKIVKARQEQQQQEAEREMEAPEKPYIVNEPAPIRTERRKRLSEVARVPMSAPSHSLQTSLAEHEPASALHPNARSTMHATTQTEEKVPTASGFECENKCEHQYELNSQKEARRAFVYSEIFTRKY
ncbi:MAG: hypothetical protein WCQ86_04530 [Bacteroidaceae bacterium]